MDLEKIQQFIKLAKEEGVSSLKYEAKEISLSVSFQQGYTSQPVVSHIQPSTNQVSAHKSEVNENLHMIKAPFVGTYYSAPSPGEDNFIKVGDKVSQGSVLCILEAMKIMNEIESDVSGEIVEICVENESFVEYGQALFKIRKS